MSANTPTAHLSTVDELDLSDEHEVALTSNADTGEFLGRIRANTAAQARQHPNPNITPEWVANAFDALDQAVVQGYRRGKARASGHTANAQILDFDEFEQRREDVLQEVRTSLTMMEAVMAAGFTVDSSLARTEHIQQREGVFNNSAEISMDGRAGSQPDQTAKERFGVPIPLVHVDYNIGSRQQAQSANFGEDIETRQAREAGRTLRETEENLYISGWGPTVPDSQGNNLDLVGVTDSSVAITGSASGDWGSASNIKDTIDSILNDLESQTSDNDRGPDPVEQGAWLWYHPNQRSDLRAADPDGDGNMTVKTRLEQDYPYLDMQAAGELSDGEIVVSVKDPRFVEIITAQAPTNLSEDGKFGLVTDYKAMASRIPFFKKTKTGIKGHVYYTGA